MQRTCTPLARRALHLVLAMAFVSVMVLYGTSLALSRHGEFYSPDSWAYFELSRTFSAEPYRFFTLRSFWSDTYSAAFPLGYPWLLHQLHRVFGVEPATGILLNLLAAALTLPAGARLSRQLGAHGWQGWLAVAMLLLYRPYSEEIFAARTIPLVILLDITALGILAGNRLTARQALVAGLLAGLATLIRFDHLVLQGLMGLVVIVRTRKALPALAFALASGCGMLPWILFSLQHFHTPWASDNSWVALASHKAYVTDFPARAAQTLFTDPAEFAGKLLSNIREFFPALATAIIKRFPGMVLLVMIIIASKRRQAGHHLRLLRKPAILCGIIIMTLLPQWLTGYFDERYFSLFLLVLALALLIQATTLIDVIKPGLLWLLPLAIILNGVSAAIGVSRQWHDATGVSARLTRENAVLAEVAACHRQEPTVRYFFDDDLIAQRYGANYQLPAGVLPTRFTHLPPDQRQYFEQRYPNHRFIAILQRNPGHFSCPPGREFPTATT